MASFKAEMNVTTQQNSRVHASLDCCIKYAIAQLKSSSFSVSSFPVFVMLLGINPFLIITPVGAALPAAYPFLCAKQTSLRQPRTNNWDDNTNYVSNNIESEPQAYQAVDAADDASYPDRTAGDVGCHRPTPGAGRSMQRCHTVHAQ